MKILRNFLILTLENLNGKLIYHHFLPFSSVPEAVAEFVAFYFLPFVVGGEFFRLVWNSDELGGGGTAPHPAVSRSG